MDRTINHGMSPGCPAVLALFAVLATGGCDSALFDFRVFDDLKDDTWVASTGVPEGLDARFYGVAIAGGGEVNRDGASFFVAGRNQDGFGQLVFDANGNLDETFYLISQVSSDPPVQALAVDVVMAADPDSARTGFAVAAGGTPQAPQQTIIALLDSNTDELITQGLVLPGPQLVDGLAFGTTNVAPSGGRNIVAVRDTLLSVLHSLDTTPVAVSCTHGRDDSLSVVVGEFAAASAMQEIAVGLSQAGGPGTVLVLEGQVVSAAGGANCFEDGVRSALATVSAPGGESDFGAVMTTGDFDNSGGLDLAVAAPNANAVYVYLNVDTSSALPTPIQLTTPPGAGEFGRVLAAGNLDGMAGDELVVTAPGTTRDGEANAGAAHVYEFSAGGFGQPQLLGDSEPEAEHRFGQAAAVVPFGSTREILVVGADREVFTYFRTRPDDADVRHNRQ